MLRVTSPASERGLRPMVCSFCGRSLGVIRTGSSIPAFLVCSGLEHGYDGHPFWAPAVGYAEWLDAHPGPGLGA